MLVQLALDLCFYWTGPVTTELLKTAVQWVPCSFWLLVLDPRASKHQIQFMGLGQVVKNRSQKMNMKKKLKLKTKFQNLWKMKNKIDFFSKWKALIFVLGIFFKSFDIYLGEVWVLMKTSTYEGVSNIGNPPLETSHLCQKIFLHQWGPKRG
jgi:hypothetical protein